MQTSTRNGIGTKLLFHRALGDGTYEATVWFTFIWIPLFPKSTWRIRPVGVTDEGSNAQRSVTTYQVEFMERRPTTAARVLMMYAGVAAAFAAIVGPIVFYFWLTGVQPEIQQMAGGLLWLVPMLVGFAVFAWLDYRRTQIYKGANSHAAGQAAG